MSVRRHPILPKRIRRESQKLLTRISRATRSGDQQRRRGLIDLYLTSDCARLEAAHDALFRKRKNESLTREKVEHLADQINVRRPCGEAARLHLRQKPGGGVRPILSFSPHMYARQLICAKVIKASHTIPAFIFNVKGHGGRNAAIENIRNEIKNGAKFAVVADIRNCYGSFNTEGMEKILNLPRKVVRYNLIAQNLTLRS